MGVHVEWVDAATTHVVSVGPGGIEDDFGTTNERVALVLHLDDAVVIEGTPAELEDLLRQMFQCLDER